MKTYEPKNRGGKVYLHRVVRISLLVATASLPFVVFGAAAATATASPAPITLAYITDLTGEGAAENSASVAGFEARIDMQNAQGGVNGHKLVPLVIDDQTSPSEITTAV
jgi:branched-chain amino acid transport system substrate-binding protein